MPSFDRETIEKWREERVSQTNLEKNLSSDDIRRIISVIEQDISVEEKRLDNAKNQVIESKSNIRRLNKRLSKAKERLQKLESK